jgi:hypothetical protein
VIRTKLGIIVATTIAVLILAKGVGLVAFVFTDGCDEPRRFERGPVRIPGRNRFDA